MSAYMNVTTRKASYENLYKNYPPVAIAEEKAILLKQIKERLEKMWGYATDRNAIRQEIPMDQLEEIVTRYIDTAALFKDDCVALRVLRDSIDESHKDLRNMR